MDLRGLSNFLTQKHVIELHTHRILANHSSSHASTKLGTSNGSLLTFAPSFILYVVY